MKTSLRVGINLGNTQLVTGRAEDGSPTGPAPEFAARIAAALGQAPVWVEYQRPTGVADGAALDEWDICLIGADPARGEHIVFSRPWIRLEVCYAVPSTSALTTNSNVDAEGVRVAAVSGGAYTLWLERNLETAELVRCNTIDDSEVAALDGRADVVAGLRARLSTYGPELRPFAENVMNVDQAVGIRRDADAAFTATVLAIVDTLNLDDPIL
jgi:polar amino acid transport system substrate-binding protein